jgi:hypothetical protein
VEVDGHEIEFWPKFVDGLNRVFGAPTPKSEDLVRYVFFQALVSAGVEIERFAFEYPHPVNRRARVDTVLVDADGQPVVAVEVKYHRSNESGANLPRTELAGMLVHDVARLAEFTPPDTQRLLLYVTDGAMAGYYSNPSNGLEWVTGLAEGDTTVVSGGSFEALSSTFRKAVGDWPGPVPITVHQAADSLAGHTIRLFGVGQPTW